MKPAGKFPEYLLVVLIAAVVLGVNHRTVSDINPGPWVAGDASDYYNLLVRGFLRGQTSLSVAPAPELLQLPNPYDPGLRKGLGMHDVSYYRGRYFIYFGVTPAVTLFTPWRILTGGHLPSARAPEIFVAVGFLASSALWLALRRRYFPGSGLFVLAGGLLALGLGSMTYAVLRRPDIWEIPISAGYACSMLALLALWRALHAVRPAAWFAVSGLLLGAAVGARPSYAVAVPILALAVVLRATRRGEAARARVFLSSGAALAIGLGLPAVGLMAYNFLRFGNPAEFGLRYQLSGVDPTTARYFSPSFVAYNVIEYFAGPAHWGRYFPFIELPDSYPPAPPGYYAVEYVYGLFSNFPFTWLALASPLAFWRGRSGAGPLAEFAMLLAAWAASMTLFLMTFNTATARYAVDFAPAIMLVAGVGALELESLARHRLSRAVAGLAIAAAGAAAAFVGLMLNYQLLDLFAFHQPAAYSRTAHFFNSLSARVESLVGAAPSRGPIELTVRFPKNHYGHLEPLITTGRFFQADHFFVVYPNSREIVLGLDHTSHGTTLSEVLPIDYDRPHVLRVELGSLVPPRAHPVYDRMNPIQVGTLVRQLLVTLDGRVVIDRSLDFYPASPESLRIGDNGYGGRFSGRIESIKRLRADFPEAPPPAYGDISLSVAFPEFRGVAAEPLVSAGRTGSGDVLRVLYLRPGAVRFGYDHWGFPMIESPEVAIPPGWHSLRIRMPSLVPPGAPPALRGRVVVSLDGRRVWDSPADAHPSTPEDVAVGTNRIGSSVGGTAFTGKISNLQILAPEAEAAP